MKFPEEFIKHGRFKLHSGEYSDTLYDVNSMVRNIKYTLQIRDSLPKFDKGNETYVGIATGGAIIASLRWEYYNWAIIKDGEVKGEIFETYYLIDDVVTTESSIKEAIKIIGKQPKKIFVVVDRRKEQTLDIESMYQV